MYTLTLCCYVVGFLVESTLDDSVHGGNLQQYVRFAQRAEHHNSKQPLLVIFASEDNVLDMKEKVQPGESQITKFLYMQQTMGSDFRNLKKKTNYNLFCGS